MNDPYAWMDNLPRQVGHTTAACGLDKIADMQQRHEEERVLLQVQAKCLPTPTDN